MTDLYNTNSEVPSNAIPDFSDNMKVFDAFVNNESGTVTSRKGVELPVLQEQVGGRIDDLTATAQDTLAGAQMSANTATEQASVAGAHADSAAASAASAVSTLSSAVKGANTFAAGATLYSFLDLINDGTNLYYWTGSFPKIVSAGASPDDDGYGLGFWAVAGDAVFRSEFKSTDGFKNVGHVASYADLQQLVPAYEGQHVLLESFRDGWADLFKPSKGQGEFVAIKGNVNDDGGSICRVNDSWYWLRLVDGSYSPEMFGAYGDGSADDAPAIAAAMQAARSQAVGSSSANCYVKGTGIYKIGSTITVTNGYIASPSGLSPRVGFRLELATVIADSTVWDDIPVDWWNATPAFRPGESSDNLTISVDQFDGGGKASFLDTKDGSISTSSIYVGHSRNHIIVYKNFKNAATQGTMNRISGHNWESGYMGALVGASPSAIAECHEFDVRWCANHRYQGLSLQDHTNYANVIAGTYDFNGKYSSCVSLTNLTSSEPTDIEFGDAISNGTITGTALSALMNWNGTWVLMLTESADKTNGTSDYKIGDTLTFGSWSATISGIQLCSTNPAFYFDLVLCCRTGDFNKSTVMPTYLGGHRGHNDFTNFLTNPNSNETTGAVNVRGLGIYGGSDSLYLGIRHLFGDNTAIGFTSSGMAIYQPLSLGNNAIYGSTAQYNATAGTQFTAVIFSAADSEINAHYYTVNIGSSISAQWAQAVVRVGASGIIVCNFIQNEENEYITLTPSGLSLLCTVAGSDSLITVATRRDI